MATISLQNTNRPDQQLFEKRKVSSSTPQQRKKAFEIRLGLVMGALVLAISVTCFQYLTQFNYIASQGVQINELQRDRAKLIIENEVWNMRIAQLKSMDVIEQQQVVRRMPGVLPEELSFVDVDEVIESR